MGLGPPKGLSIMNCITTSLHAVMLCGIRRYLFLVQKCEFLTCFLETMKFRIYKAYRLEAT